MECTVTIEKECRCFKESEYESEKTFNNQQEAYQYAHIVAEFMNEDFCSTHLFSACKTTDDNFVITVTDNPKAGGCGTGSCDTDDNALTESSSCASGSCGC